MEAARWRRVLGSLTVLAGLGSLALGGPATPDAAGTPWQPPPCPGAAWMLAEPGIAPGAWYRLSLVLDATGTLAAQRLTVGAHGAVEQQADLPPESFAAGPVEGLLVVGDDDGSRSRVRVVDVGRDCVRSETLEADVVRSAILAPGQDELWEHRVDRATRADLGVWRRPLDGDAATQALPGLAPDTVHGPTFATDLRWTADDHLVVATCGALVCRTRVLDADGRVDTVDDTGPALGFAAGRLVAFATCHAVACPIVAIDPVTGSRTTLAGSAGPAELGGPDDRLLLYAAADGTLAIVDVATLRRTTLPAAPGMAPVRRGSIATAGADVAPGSLLLAPSGWFAGPAEATTVDPAAGIIETLEEAQR